MTDLAPSGTLLQITPPGSGGVADYASCLVAGWGTSGIRSDCIAVSNTPADEDRLYKTIAERVSGSPCAVVLHFSGYGYAKRGLCFWLVDALATLRARHGERMRLIVVFHELFATGEPVWRSAFWLSHLQARIAARLARLADAIWTNTEQHARWLHGHTHPGTPVHARPVFSNVGEPSATPDLVDRLDQVVVFGSPSTRRRAFEGLSGCEPAWRDLGVGSLIEVGGGGETRTTPASVPSRYVGHLGPAELTALLSTSRFGLLDYPPQFLGKSGVFAAYAAHGCAVLNTCPLLTEADGLQAGRDYLALAAIGRADRELSTHQRRASNLSSWYEAHRLHRQARELLALAAVAPA